MVKVNCFGAVLDSLLSRKDRNSILINSEISLRFQKRLAIPSVTF